METTTSPTASQAAQIADEWLDAKAKLRELGDAIKAKEEELRAYFETTSDTVVGRIKKVTRTTKLVKLYPTRKDDNLAKNLEGLFDNPIAEDYLIWDEKTLAKDALENKDLRKTLKDAGVKPVESERVSVFFQQA